MQFLDVKIKLPLLVGVKAKQYEGSVKFLQHYIKRVGT